MHVHSAVKALIRHGDRYLFVRQDVDGTLVWDLPGGRIQFGENPYEALLREVKEETTLDVKIIQPIGLWWFFRKRDGDQVICNTFLCEIVSGSVDHQKNIPGEEKIAACVWVNADDIKTDHLNLDQPTLVDLLKNVL
jgi:8-oxo-dGTP pyrophosphatase MutT (NUDIX family)